MRVAWPAGTSGITAGAALLPPVAAPAGLRQRRRSLRVTAEVRADWVARSSLPRRTPKLLPLLCVPLPTGRCPHATPLQGQVEVPARFPASDWRRKARAIQPGSNYPAGQHCSQCGLW